MSSQQKHASPIQEQSTANAHDTEATHILAPPIFQLRANGEPNLEEEKESLTQLQTTGSNAPQDEDNSRLAGLNKAPLIKQSPALESHDSPSTATASMQLKINSPAMYSPPAFQLKATGESELNETAAPVQLYATGAPQDENESRLAGLNKTPLIKQSPALESHDTPGTESMQLKANSPAVQTPLPFQLKAMGEAEMETKAVPVQLYATGAPQDEDESRLAGLNKAPLTKQSPALESHDTPGTASPAMQLKANSSATQTPPPFQLKANGNGIALPENIQQKMGTSFQTDFSDVKVHTNSENATNLGALAYAQGNEVHFAPGQFKPDNQAGQELIGHELAHVVQQRAGRVKATTQAKGIGVNDDKGLEREADDMGRKAASSPIPNMSTIGGQSFVNGQSFPVTPLSSENEITSIKKTNPATALSTNHFQSREQTNIGNRRIEAKPTVANAVIGTEITYSIVSDPMLHAQGSYYTYQWYFLNDLITAQKLGLPDFVKAGTGYEQKATAQFEGTHTILCNEIYHPVGQPASPSFLHQFTQTVAAKNTPNTSTSDETDFNIMGVQIRRTLRNFDAKNITPDTLSHLLQSIFGLNGSSASIKLEVGLAAVRELGVFNVSIGQVDGGVKINLEGGAEVTNDGKFSLSGTAGITGFLHAEIKHLISGELEAAAMIQLEGEWDSIAHFAAYLYQQVHTKARTIVDQIRAQGFGEYVPNSLAVLADAPDSDLGQKAPEITTTRTLEAGAKGTLGGPEVSLGAGYTRSSSAYEKSVDGTLTETGNITSGKWTGQVKVGDYVGVIGITNSTVDSSIDAKDKARQVWKISVAGVHNKLDDKAFKALAELPKSMSMLGSTANTATQLGRRLLAFIKEVPLGPGLPDFSSSQKGTLAVILKFDIENGNTILKQINITFSNTIKQEVSMQVPAGGAFDIEGSASLEGTLTRTVFHESL